jgi:hypothetical protein
MKAHVTKAAIAGIAAIPAGNQSRERAVVELDEVADELYGLRPQEFTAARNEHAQRARAEGRRELAESIRGLRRPTLAAWASNLLVREQGEQVAPLMHLGEELRGAHRNLDGEELRALSHKQHQLVDALVRQADQLASAAGSPLGPQARQEVAQTLHAVLADPDAAREWAAGHLSKPLSATPGFEAAAREAAATSAGGRGGPGRGEQGRRGQQGQQRQRESRRKAPKARTEQDEKAARAAREAAENAERRRREAEAASEETASARAGREEAEERVERLRGELREAEDDRKASRQREREAERAEREARRKADGAAEAEERARRRAGASADGR